MTLFRTVFFWSLIIVGTPLVFISLFTCVQIAKLFGNKNTDSIGHSHATFWGRMYFILVPGWRMNVKGTENLPPKNEPVVYIANHQSLTDILAMYYLGRQFRWLSKEEVFKVPVIGSAMKLSGYIPIQRGDRSSGQKAMADARGVLDRGLAMFFFPEGTRSKTQELRQFKSGAFRLAEDAKVRMVPLTLNGTGNLIEKGKAWANKAAVDITIHPPMVREESESIDAFASRMRTIIGDELNRLRSK